MSAMAAHTNMHTAATLSRDDPCMEAGREALRLPEQHRHHLEDLSDDRGGLGQGLVLRCWRAGARARKLSRHSRRLFFFFCYVRVTLVESSTFPARGCRRQCGSTTCHNPRSARASLEKCHACSIARRTERGGPKELQISEAVLLRITTTARYAHGRRPGPRTTQRGAWYSLRAASLPGRSRTARPRMRATPPPLPDVTPWLGGPRARRVDGACSSLERAELKWKLAPTPSRRRHRRWRASGVLGAASFHRGRAANAAWHSRVLAGRSSFSQFAQMAERSVNRPPLTPPTRGDVVATPARTTEATDGGACGTGLSSCRSLTARPKSSLEQGAKPRTTYCVPPLQSRREDIAPIAFNQGCMFLFAPRGVARIECR